MLDGTHDRHPEENRENGYRIAAPGRPPLVAAAPIRLAAGEMRRLEVRLGDRNRVLAGTVVDQGGAPVAGLTVKARLYRPPVDAGLLVPETRSAQSVTTAADGTFEIAGLTDSLYRVGVVASERYLSAETIVRPDSQDLRLVVLEGRELTIVGEVTSTNGEALVDARVVDLDQPSRRARTDERAQYKLVAEAGTDAWNHRLRFDAEGYRSARLDVAAEAVRDLDETRLDAVLEPVANTVAVAAHLTDGAGGPVAGERVYLSSSALGARYQATSDADGRASFPAVAARGDYTFGSCREGRTRTTRRRWPTWARQSRSS